MKKIRLANKIDYENRSEACDINPVISPFKISKIISKTQQLYIVRDDYLCGGTKSRVCVDFLVDKIKEGYSDFVYVSPWNGAASLALGISMKDLDINVTVFIERYFLNELPPFLALAQTYGVNVIQTDNPYVKARRYAEDTGSYFIKPGFNYPSVIDDISYMIQPLKEEYGVFDEVWCAVGSGTLINGLQKGGIGRKYYGVCIFGVKPDIGKARAIIHDQEDYEPVDKLPPYRSAMYYDAKVYEYVRGRKGKILLWNVI